MGEIKENTTCKRCVAMCPAKTQIDVVVGARAQMVKNKAALY